MTKHNPAPRRDAVLDALRACGAASTTRIAEVMRWPPRAVRSIIAGARLDLPGKHFCIVGYEWQKGRAGRAMAIYQADGGTDAPEPRADAERRSAQKRAYRERNRAVINARAKSRRDNRDTAPQKTHDYSEETDGLPRPALPLSKEVRRALVKLHYPHISNDALSAWLGVDIKTIHADNRMFGLRKTAEVKSIIQSRTQQDTSPWQPPLVEILELMYPVMCAKDLSDLLGFPVNVIRKKACYHGWKRVENMDDHRPLCAPRPESKEKAKSAPAKAVKKPIKTAAKKPEVRSANLPSPMSAAMLARMDKERFHLTDEIMGRSPMFRPLYVPTALAYRGQQQRTSQ